MPVLPNDLRVDDRAYFRAARAAAPDAGWYVSEPLRSRATGEPFFDFSRRRSAEDGSFLGAISVSLYPSYFNRFFAEQVAEDRGLSVSLVRADGIVIARHPEVPMGARLSKESPLLAAMAAGIARGQHSGISSLDGQKKLVSFRKIGDLPLYAVAVADVQATLAPWRRSMIQLAAITLALALALASLSVLAMRLVRREQGAERALREQAEQRLRAEEALRHAQKLEALGRLTGGVAHDFNNVLMVVQSSASLIAHLVARGQPPERPLAAISRAVNSGAQLTRQLLAFARRQPLKIEVCKLADTIEAMRPLILSAAGSAVRVNFEVEPELPSVEVDVAELELGLLNLVNNARDAMQDSGEIWISADASAPPDGLSLGAGWIKLCVRDAGPGIPPELRQKVLEPFFTTKPSGKGTGLGLSQVQAFAEQSKGRLTLQSTPGKGTIVCIHLPATTRQATAATVATELPPMLSGHVLLVEDNVEIAAALVPLLQSKGARVTHLASADDALRALEQDGLQPDMLLTDIQMPGGKSGLDLATTLRRRRPSLPIVLMTGYTAQLSAALAQGFTVLPKPVSPERLASALSDAMKARERPSPTLRP